MKNIQKSLWYQLKKDWIDKLLSILTFGGPTFILLIGGEWEHMSGTMAAASISEFLPMLIFYFVCVSVPQICFGDLKDKTINYEILAGHKRNQVFWGRVLMTYKTVLPVIVGSIILAIGTATIANGFGASITLPEILVVYGMFLCITIRLIAECILLTLLIGDSLASRFLCAALQGVITMPAEFLMILDGIGGENSKINGFYSAACRLLNVLDFHNHRTGFADGKDMIQFIITPDAFKWTMDSVGMLVITAVVLFVTYRIFMKKDI